MGEHAAAVRLACLLLAASAWSGWLAGIVIHRLGRWPGDAAWRRLDPLNATGALVFFNLATSAVGLALALSLPWMLVLQATAWQGARWTAGRLRLDIVFWLLLLGAALPFASLVLAAGPVPETGP